MRDGMSQMLGREVNCAQRARNLPINRLYFYPKAGPQSIDRGRITEQAMVTLLHFIYVTIGGDCEFVGHATKIFHAG